MEEKLRSLFFTGNFPQLLDYKGRVSESISLLMSRAQVLMGKAPSSDLPNLKVLANYQKTGEPSKLANDPLEELLSLVFLLNSDQESIVIDSIKLDSLEKKILFATALLKLRRPDVASSSLKAALNENEEEGAFSLLLACTCFVKGEFEECASLTNELISKYGESPVLLNLYALSLMEEGNFARAENLLKKAVDQSKEFGVGSYLEMSLRNLIACKRMVGEVFADIEQYVLCRQLQGVNPKSEYFVALKAASDLFDQSLS